MAPFPVVSCGGRDNAGMVGGFLGADRRVYVTHDRSLHGPSRAGKVAVMLTAELIGFNKNKLLRAEPIAQQINDDQIRFGAHMPELATQ